LTIISKFDNFSLISQRYCQCQLSDSDTGKYWSVWHHIMTYTV